MISIAKRDYSITQSVRLGFGDVHGKTALAEVEVIPERKRRQEPTRNVLAAAFAPDPQP
ncbi:hypothetical protein ABZ297_33895 [Nonomuraea sp. NPDC005983]|uniref:hypothetical protein n=1 Tax=Nonomuraea sp. NPDC005983 TaxID=3155595 RepID=UPI0033BE70EE